MIEIIRFKLPVYWTYISKKKEKNVLLSLNWALNANPFVVARAKKWYLQVIMDSIPIGATPIEGQYIVNYTYHYKNVKSDLPNVVPVVSKFLLDALQTVALTEEDSVKFCIEEHSYVGEKTDNPHIIVEIIKKEI